MSDHRSSAVEAFLRGAAWLADDGVAYPRADPSDARRLPADTWLAAQIPVGVRLELTGSASAVELTYYCPATEPGYRGAGAGTTFSAWHAGEQIDERPAVQGEGRVQISVGRGQLRTTIYLPEGMRPIVTGIRPIGGDIQPAAAQHRWIAYGDSITEGWVATSPARCWPAIVARAQSLDVVNLGYAGSARGEIPTAEQIATLDADIISIAYGTNCWSMTPHSVEMIRANTTAFLQIVRSGHPGIPVVVISPLLRPDAENQRNRLGATLAELRTAMEEAATAADDERVTLVPGGPLLTADTLADGIHPGDDGHKRLAEVIGPCLTTLLGEDPTPEPR